MTVLGIPLELIPYFVAIAVVFAAAFRQVEASEIWRSFRPATRAAVYLWGAWMLFHGLGRGWFDELARPAPQMPWALALANIAMALGVILLMFDRIYLCRSRKRRRHNHKIVVGLDARD